MKVWMGLIGAGGMALAISGCQSGNAQGPAPVGTGAGASTASANVPPLKVIAGVPPSTAAVGGPFDVRTIAVSKQFSVRSGDPFALLPSERRYEMSQTAERLLAENGGFSNLFTEALPTPDDISYVEPLPQWRLAGVVIGDGVAALLDMGNGQVVDIRPGARVPGTDWTVASINAERAILRRSGPRLPHEFVVTLKGPIGGSTGGFGGGGFPGGAAPGGLGGPATMPGGMGGPAVAPGMGRPGGIGGGGIRSGGRIEDE